MQSQCLLVTLCRRGCHETDNKNKPKDPRAKLMVNVSQNQTMVVTPPYQIVVCKDASISFAKEDPTWPSFVPM
jgi:hypothetical protein